MNEPDVILIDTLELFSCIGITPAEQAEPQRLGFTAEIEPLCSFGLLDDCIEKTVDYFHVAIVAKEVALARPRNLIETLAEDLASELMRRFAIRRITLEIRKYILPDTKHVGVRITRIKQGIENG